MRTLTMLLALVSLAMGDVSHLGYQYKVPHTSYGVPAYASGNNQGFSSGVGGASSYQEQSVNQAYHGSGFVSSQQNGGNQGGYQGTQFTHSSGNQGAGAGQHNGGSHGNHHHHGSFGHQSSGGQSGYQGAGFAQQQSGYQAFGGSGASYQNFDASAGFTERYRASSLTVQQQPAQVFKHVYVHEAPEEPEPPRPRQQLVLPPPQKHYKIIFIKAPTSTVYANRYVAVPQQNEEKTIVYLLHKKSEELKDEVVPQIEAKPPTKPEVFFVKYHNKEDSQAVINNIVQEHSKENAVFSGASFDGGSDGHIAQNEFSKKSSSTAFSQQGGAGAAGESVSYLVPNNDASASYNQGDHGQANSGHYTGSEHYSHGITSPVTDHHGSSTGGVLVGPGFVTPTTSYGTPAFDGTVDTIVSTSQGLPHNSYSNFRM